MKINKILNELWNNRKFKKETYGKGYDLNFKNDNLIIKSIYYKEQPPFFKAGTTINYQIIYKGYFRSNVLCFNNLTINKKLFIKTLNKELKKWIKGIDNENN